MYVQGNKKTTDRYLKDSLKEICENIVNFCGGKYKILDEKSSGFSLLNLKIARILSVEKHPDADRLYILKIDLGKEKRQLVAGLKPYYEPSDLKGKKIVVVTNLKPADLKGIRSEGMLLAASLKDKVKVLEAKKSNPGDQVYIEDVTVFSKEITIKEFQRIKIKTKNRKAVFDGKFLKTQQEEISADIEDDARIS